MNPVVLRLDVFVAGMNGDDDPDAMTPNTNEVSVSAVLNIKNGLGLTSLPSSTIRIDASDILDTLMGI